MPVPAHRRSRSRVRSRRAHDAMKSVSSSVCASCNAPIMPHRACPNCGLYNGRKVVDMTRRAARLLKGQAAAPKAVAPKKDHDHKHE